MTPEERAANAELDDTVRRLVPALNCIDPGEAITTWVLVGHAAIPDDEEASRYFQVGSGGDVPPHIAEGLLRRGLRLLNSDVGDVR